MQKFTEISSKDNALIKYVSKLQKSSRFRYSERKFVIEGQRIAKDAFENGVLFETLIVNKTFFDKYKDEVSAFSENTKNLYLLSDSLFEKICDTETPQGIIVIANMPSIEHRIDLKGKYLALDNLRDPSNLGAIARTCEALGVSGIVINNTSCDPFSPKSIRASMGTLLRIPLFIIDDLSLFIKTNKLRSFACVVDSDALSISDVDFRSADIVIIGNEANGISDEVKANADNLITIKMSGKAESLNAAAAAAIAIYELTK